jgi:hypothetical protein
MQLKPDEQIDISIDGMGGWHSLPYRVKNVLSWASMLFLKMLVYGVVIYTPALHRIMFTGLDVFPQTPNLVISIIHAVLVRYLSASSFHPATLVLHLDNCFHDNKNFTIIAYCSYLVAIGWFSEIRIQYLITGHTHDLIDQMFSNIRKCAWGFVAATLGQFNLLLQQIYHTLCRSGQFEALNISHCWDWQSWFLPHVHQFSHLNDVHQIRLFRHSSSDSNDWTVGMQVRRHSSQGDWLPQIFIPLQSIPVGVPDDIPADYSNITVALCNRVADLLRRDPALADSADWWKQLSIDPATTSGTFYSAPLTVEDLFPSTSFKALFSPTNSQSRTSNLPPLGFSVRPRAGVPSSSSPLAGDLLLLTDRSVAEFVESIHVNSF